MLTVIEELPCHHVGKLLTSILMYKSMFLALCVYQYSLSMVMPAVLPFMARIENISEGPSLNL